MPCGLDAGKSGTGFDEKFPAMLYGRKIRWHFGRAEFLESLVSDWKEETAFWINCYGNGLQKPNSRGISLAENLARNSQRGMFFSEKKFPKLENFPDRDIEKFVPRLSRPFFRTEHGKLKRCVCPKNSGKFPKPPKFRERLDLELS
jgi:hypothetical protein